MIALLASIGVAAGLGLAAWGDQTIRGTNGVVVSETPHYSTLTTTTTPAVTSVGASTSSPPPASSAHVTAPKAAGGGTHNSTRPVPPPPPPPPPPPDPGGPAVALAQAADCVQTWDMNQLVASVQAPAGLAGVALVAAHSSDGTVFNGAMDGDGATYRADIGPFSDYPDPQTVTWTVTVTDAAGRTTQAAKQFSVSSEPCSP